ncbi:hypothetical protein McanCB56680_007003 [Microsporum canis]
MGPHSPYPVRVAMAVDMEETPNYENPFSKQENISIYKSNMDNHPGADIEALIAQNCERRPPFTPISIHGLRWAGELNASIQVFAKDPITGEPIEKAPRTVRESKDIPAFEECPNLNVRISDLVPMEGGVDSKYLALDWDELRFLLAASRQRLASK